MTLNELKIIEKLSNTIVDQLEEQVKFYNQESISNREISIVATRKAISIVNRAVIDFVEGFVNEKHKN